MSILTIPKPPRRAVQDHVRHVLGMGCPAKVTRVNAGGVMAIAMPFVFAIAAIDRTCSNFFHDVTPIQLRNREALREYQSPTLLAL